MASLSTATWRALAAPRELLTGSHCWQCQQPRPARVQLCQGFACSSGAPGPRRGGSSRRASGEHAACKTGPPRGPLEAQRSSTPAQPPKAGSSTAAAAALATALAALQALAPVPDGASPGAALAGWGGPPPASAILYSPDTKIPRSPEVALRKAIPAVNPTMKKIQSSLEDIFFLLRIPQRKPFGTMESDVRKAMEMAASDKAAILAVVPDDKKDAGAALFESLTSGKNGLEGLLAAIQQQDPDRVSIRLTNVLETVGNLELLQAPGLPFLVSSQFENLPRLTGRATAAFEIARPDGSTFTVAEGGGGKGAAVLEVVLDGFSAPLTAGNLMDLILKGAYDGVTVSATPQAVLMQGGISGHEIPLEILPAGEFQPIYKTPLNVQDGELPVLPMSVYGAAAMSHSVDSETTSHPSQFFFYLYDKKSSGLGGLSFEEGQFSVFGYVTKGRELLSQIRSGDMILSAKITSGLEHFVPGKEAGVA